MSHLQFQHAGTLHHPEGGHWSKTKHEAQASWNTPIGPGRYRISHTVYSGGDYYEVVRLKPTTSTLPDGKPRKFSGYGLGGHPRDMKEAIAIAERDNARLCGEAP